LGERTTPGVGARNAQPRERPLGIGVHPGDAEGARLRHALLVGLFERGKRAALVVKEHPLRHEAISRRAAAGPQGLLPAFRSTPLQGYCSPPRDRIAIAFSPLRDASPQDILAWSRRAETLGYEGVFIPESFCDSLTYAQAVALGTTRLKVGTAITNVYLR